MTNYSVIGLVGKQASGKTVAASELEKRGAERVRMGDIVWNEIEERNLEVTEENVGTVANKLRKEEGMDAIAKKSIPLIREKGEESGAVVVDGIRGIAEVEKFRKEFGEDFYLISIEASDKARYERIRNRKREDDINNLKKFREKEDREMNWGLKEAIKSADYRIVNEKTIEEFREKISNKYMEIINENYTKN